MLNSPEGAAEQSRGLEPAQPIPPDVTGKGKERWSIGRIASTAAKVGLVLGPMTVLGLGLGVAAALGVDRLLGHPNYSVPGGHVIAVFGSQFVMTIAGMSMGLYISNVLSRH